MDSDDTERINFTQHPDCISVLHPHILTLLDLPWEDVLFRYVLSRLPLQTQFHLRQVNTQCKELITLYFSKAQCVDISRTARRMTREAFKILTKNNSALLFLVLRNAKDWLDTSVLTPVLRVNKRLTKLDLTYCSSVTNASLDVVAGSCQQLRMLVLRDCHWVSAEGLGMVALRCTRLEHVDLTGCWDLHDKDVILLVLQCKHIRYLSLAKIYGITDHAMSLLAREAPSLEHLNIQGCWRLSDDSVRLLGEYCHTLGALQVRECRDVTEASLARLRVRGIKIDVRPPSSLRHLSAQLNLQI